MILLCTSFIAHDREQTAKELQRYQTNLETQVLLLKKVLDSISEGVIIKTKSEDSKLLMKNKEAKRLFPTQENLLKSECLVPTKQNANDLQINASEALSIEQASSQQNKDIFYHVIDPSSQLPSECDKDKLEIIGIDSIEITLNNQECQLIMMKNWSSMFRY